MSATDRELNALPIRASDVREAREQPAVQRGFEVRLARRKCTIAVQAGQTILEALLDAGIVANYACMEGVCAPARRG